MATVKYLSLCDDFMSDKYIEVEELSSFSIAAEIHKDGGVVRVKDESEFYVDFKGLTVKVMVHKGDVNYVSLTIRDVLVASDVMNQHGPMEIINNHVLSLAPCAVASLSQSSEPGKLIITIRSDIACDYGLLMAHFNFYIYRFFIFTEGLFNKFSRAGCNILAHDMIKVAKRDRAPA